jgi:hypothetical protein
MRDAYNQARQQQKLRIDECIAYNKEHGRGKVRSWAACGLLSCVGAECSGYVFQADRACLALLIQQQGHSHGQTVCGSAVQRVLRTRHTAFLTASVSVRECMDLNTSYF